VLPTFIVILFVEIREYIFCPKYYQIDAPANFDFTLYCIVKDMPEIYYVPDSDDPTAIPTNKLPRSSADEVGDHKS
jgi:hypothetical protein